MTLSAPAFAHAADLMLEQIRSAGSFDAVRHIDVSTAEIETALAQAVLNLHLLGRAQVWMDVAEPSRKEELRAGQMVLGGSVEPLPFEEALEFFRRKTNLSPEAFYALTEVARIKAFTIAVGAEETIIEAIHDLVNTALSDGLTLREFQAAASIVLDHAGVSAATPWYWSTVYRTNLQQAYQVGRWQQMADPAVRAERPYIRYISARLPTSRPSHVEKHGLIFPAEHSFWDEFAPPNGFNCAPAGTLVNTAQGQIPIEQVKHGDLVLTHEGRWQPVTELHRNLFRGSLVRVTTSDSRILRLTPNHKVFTRRGWVEAVSLNTLDEIGDYAGVANNRALSLRLPALPLRLQASGPEVVQRDSLRLNRVVTTQDHPVLFVAKEFNADLVVRQVEVNPIGGEVSVEEVTNAVLIQETGKSSFPLRHGHFRNDMRMWPFLMSLSNGGNQLLSNLWSFCYRGISRLFSNAGQARMVKFRAATRPMIRLWMRRLVDFSQALSLHFSTRGTVLPRGNESFTQRSTGNAEKVQKLWQGVFVVKGQEAANLTPRPQFLAVEPTQSDGGVFFSDSSDALNNDVDGVSHNHCIIQRYCEFSNIVSIEKEPFSGLVYNLGVAEDHSYCIEGLAVHNCRCTTMSVSNSLLSRRGWHVSDEMNFQYPHADEGFQYNAGKVEAI